MLGGGDDDRCASQWRRSAVTYALLQGNGLQRTRQNPRRDRERRPRYLKVNEKTLYHQAGTVRLQECGQAIAHGSSVA
jgi:hypothetical protein